MASIHNRQDAYLYLMELLSELVHTGAFETLTKSVEDIEYAIEVLSWRQQSKLSNASNHSTE